MSLAISEHFGLQSPPVIFAGTVLVASFADVTMLAATYRIAGSIPILSPLARFPRLFKYLSTFIQDKWLSKDRIAEYIRANEANGEKYRLTLIHAKDDYDIPWHHTEVLFWHAVNATVSRGISYDELEDVKYKSRTDRNGVIREETLKTGQHDVVMGYPVITMAVMRIFEAADASFK